MTAPRILVVDDDLRLRELLQRYLLEQGFSPDCVADGGAMDDALQQRCYSALVLDLMLPGEDGLEICRRLRAQGSSLPILILTARGDEVDRIVGLEMGADDYLPKPFNPRELVARLRAILRRVADQETLRKAGNADADHGDGQVPFGPFVLDAKAHQLFKDGQPLTLTGGEFALLRVLVEHPRRPLSRDSLINLSRGREHNPFDRSVDVLISRLRRLLESDPAKPCYLQTVRGVGYRFNPKGCD